MAVVEEVRLIFADPEKNNNKFWHGFLYENGDVTVEWGRVGYKTQTKTHPSAGQKKLSSLKNSKLKKGYTEQKTINGTSSQPVASSSLRQTAIRDIGGCPEIQKLVKYLADVNVHDIVSNTNISFNAEAGTFSTPLGLVTSDGIDEARDVLNKITAYTESHNLDAPEAQLLAGNYLRIIPQNVGMARGWHLKLFGSDTLLSKQYDILDSLEASLKQATATTQVDRQEPERVFEVKLDLVEDGKIFDKVRRRYQKSKGGHSTVRHLDVTKIYAVNIPSMSSGFEKDGQNVGNIQQLWHGTKAANLLSILKVGLIIPPYRPGFCAGRAFGDGLYFSDMSTKSLQYAGGFAPGQTRTGAGKYFMFLADVAMGKPYETSRMMQSIRKAPQGYDSVWCKPNSVFRNDERIVYRTTQANLVYLIEFS